MLRSLTLATGLLCVASAPFAAEPSGTSGAPADTQVLTYTRIYTDKDGVSHFAEERLTFKADASPLLVASLGKPLEAAVAMLREGAFEDWHNAPRRQFLIVIRGTSEVQTSDGEVRRFPVGSVLLMEDTSGKGHTTRVIGQEDHAALVIPVAP
jgi:quercetin dioxygenase-like cupin family protein